MSEPRLTVRVMHEYFGCETGCCGHVVEVGKHSAFEFVHNYDEKDEKEWARTIAEIVIRDKWPECLPLIDWESLTVETTDAC